MGDELTWSVPVINIGACETAIAGYDIPCGVAGCRLICCAWVSEDFETTIEPLPRG